VVALKVILRPAKGEIIVDGDTEEIRSFLEWYLTKTQTNLQVDIGEKQDKKTRRRTTHRQQSKPPMTPVTTAQQASQQIDTSGLPSFAKDNPWLYILSTRQ
jgi:hypothetical protein